MGMIPLDLDPPPKKLRQFGWIAPVMLLVIGGVMRWRFGMPVAGVAALGVAGVVILIASLVSPKLVRPVYVAMVVAGYPIGWVVSHLVMFVVYFGVITPVALVFRLLGRDPLHRRWDPGCDTYWTRHPPCDSSERYFRQF